MVLRWRTVTFRRYFWRSHRNDDHRGDTAFVVTRLAIRALPELGLGIVSERLVLLSQKVATNDEENHLFGKIHTSAMGGWNGSAKIE